MPISGINMTYNNTGVIGPQDGDIQIKLKEDHRPTAETRAGPARAVAAAVPGMTFAFLPADIVSQDFELRRTCADRSSGSWCQRECELRLRQQDPGPDPENSGYCRCAHPAIAEQPDLQYRCRSDPRAVGRADERDVTNSLVVNLAGSGAGGADLFSQSG